MGLDGKSLCTINTKLLDLYLFRAVQLNWEKNLKNIVKDSEAISPLFLAHYTPNEPPTILVC